MRKSPARSSPGRRSLRRLAASLSLLPGVALAQEPGGRVSVEQDLLAVLTLRGRPCERVASYERLGESDYLVVCSDGHRYRVFIDDERVEIEER